MIYHSPLRFLENLGVDQTDFSNLKLVRQRLLLQFDLAGTTTIDIASKSYDKALIISIFEDLKDNVDFHLKIFNNKLLLSLLENGKLEFFDHPDAWPDFENETFSKQVMPYFIAMVEDVIYHAVAQNGPDGVDLLLKIKKSRFQYPGVSEHEVYSKGYRYYELWLDNAEEIINGHYSELSSGRRFDFDVFEIFDRNIFNKLEALPKHIFGEIIMRYGRLANRVLGKAFSQNKRFYKFDRKSLKALRTACDIYFIGNPEDLGVRKLAEDIGAYLKNSGVKGLFKGAVFIVIFICSVVFLFFSQKTGNSVSSTNVFANSNIAIDNEAVEMIMLAENPMFEGAYSSDMVIGKLLLAEVRTIHISKMEKSNVSLSLLGMNGLCICKIKRPINCYLEKGVNGELPDVSSTIQFQISGRPIYEDCDEAFKGYKITRKELQEMTFFDSFEGEFILDVNTLEYTELIVGNTHFKKK